MNRRPAAAAVAALLLAAWLPAQGQAQARAPATTPTPTTSTPTSPSPQFREVTSAAAVLYDGPSERARKLFIAVRGTPLELVSTLNEWVKVRDLGGDVLWVQRSELGEARHVLASTLASVRRRAQINGELVVQVERGVLLEVLDASAPAGWLRVRHRDGITGFVSTDEVWGR